MPALLFLLSFTVAAELTEQAGTVPQPNCRASIEVQCTAVASLERAVCESAFSAHCHVEEAGLRLVDKDMSGAISELRLASLRYDTLFRASDASQLKILTDFLIRYADTIAMVFTPGQLAGEGPVMQEASDFLRAGYGRLLELSERRPEVARDENVKRITATVAEKCRDLLEDLGRSKLRAATQEQVSIALAEGLANAAINLFREALLIRPVTTEREASLLKLLVTTQLARAGIRRNNQQRSNIRRISRRESCNEQGEMLAELDRFRAKHPQMWDATLVDLRSRVDAAFPYCAGRHMILAGAILGTVGALSLAASIGLYADYDNACDRNSMDMCRGLRNTPFMNDEYDRYRRQAQTAIGLAFVGGTLVAVSIPLFAVGGTRRASLRKKHARFTPVFSPAFAGATISLKF